jgi:hypothetical protein
VASELAVEGGQITETGTEGDVTDRASLIHRIYQHPVDACESPAEHETGEGYAFALKQLVDVT